MFAVVMVITELMHVKERQEKQRPSQRSSRKINDVCLSQMYVDEYSDHHVEVIYISAHMNHQLGSAELPH